MNNLVRSESLPLRDWRLMSWWSALSRVLRQRAERQRMKRQVRRSIGELLTADKRLLADIGLTRADVEYAVRHGRMPRG